MRKLKKKQYDIDLKELNSFLCSGSVPKGAMNAATLEGFFTAIVIGPNVVPPSQWMDWVWDSENGESEVMFDTQKQAQKVMQNMMEIMNYISGQFSSDPQKFEPVFYRGQQWAAKEWCEGFLKATSLFDAEQWQLLWTMDVFKDMSQDRIGLVTPFLRLSDEADIELSMKEESTQKWIDLVRPKLVEIHAFWLERRSKHNNKALITQEIQETKVGRNDPCPCGSGKKQKKCCGKPVTIH